VENLRRASITLSRNVLVLALDTTTRAGSVAVVEGTDGVARVLSQLVGDASLTHGARLPGDLMRVLDAASVAVETIDLLAVAAGPGSFTGLRVGIAAMQGLAMAIDRRIVPVSALDALAAAGANPAARVACWMDAQRGEVFATLFDPSGTETLVPPSAAAPDRTLDTWEHTLAGRGARFIGDGAVRYAELIRSRVPESDVVEPPPLAAVIGRLAIAAPGRAVAPHAVVPIYIRKPDAELARDRSSP
jgi:tRNA threonylcarbamoyladenosine biosynthesis protein TsaB